MVPTVPGSSFGFWINGSDGSGSGSVPGPSCKKGPHSQIIARTAPKNFLNDLSQERPRRKKKTKERSVHPNFSQGHSGTKVRYVNRACFPREEKTQEFTKMWAKFVNFSFWPFFGLVCRGDS